MSKILYEFKFLKRLISILVFNNIKEVFYKKKLELGKGFDIVTLTVGDCNPKKWNVLDMEWSERQTRVK